MNKLNEYGAHVPMVSIVMPSYNCATFVEQSIQSVLKQSMKDWELLIVDDCSTDDTVVRISSIATQDSRIHLICLKQNEGAAVARNTAIHQAKGRYIAFLDADDTWAADKLQKQVAFMEQNGYAFSYTNYHETSVHVSGPERVSRRIMEIFCWMGCSTVMYNREIIGEVQITPLRKNNDYAIWLHVCQVADCYLLAEDLTTYNRHQGSISSVSPWVKISWHYRLWRQERQCNPFAACWHTFINAVASIYKNMRYVTRVN